MAASPRCHSLALGGLLALACALAQAQSVTVIAHPSVTLPADEVRELFVGDRQFVGSVKLVPIDNLAAQRGFLASVLHLEPVKYATLWAKKAFRDGLTAPAAKASDAEVLAFVQSTPGAIGYVTSGNLPLRDVRVLGDKF